MRASYLRQIARPVAAEVPVLNPSRRWPLRADEQRVPAPPSATMPQQPEPAAAKAVTDPAWTPVPTPPPARSELEPRSTRPPSSPEVQPDVTPAASSPSVAARAPSAPRTAHPVADVPVARRQIAPSLPPRAAPQSPAVRGAPRLAEAESGAASG